MKKEQSIKKRFTSLAHLFWYCKNMRVKGVPVETTLQPDGSFEANLYPLDGEANDKTKLMK